MIDPTPFIRSYVPGRLRLRHSSLIGLECDARGALTSAVKSVPGITACVVNPKVGSLFLTWDAEKLTKDDLLGYLQFWAAFSPEDAQGGYLALGEAGALRCSYRDNPYPNAGHFGLQGQCGKMPPTNGKSSDGSFRSSDDGFPFKGRIAARTNRYSVCGDACLASMEASARFLRDKGGGHEVGQNACSYHCDPGICQCPCGGRQCGAFHGGALFDVCSAWARF